MILRDDFEDLLPAPAMKSSNRLSEKYSKFDLKFRPSQKDNVNLLYNNTYDPVKISANEEDEYLQSESDDSCKERLVFHFSFILSVFVEVFIFKRIPDLKKLKKKCLKNINFSRICLRNIHLLFLI